jgi:hypothetical protein
MRGYRDGRLARSSPGHDKTDDDSMKKLVCRLANANAEPMQVITTPAPPHTPLNRRVPIRELMSLRQQAKEIHPPRFHHGLVTRCHSS